MAQSQYYTLIVSDSLLVPCIQLLLSSSSLYPSFAVLSIYLIPAPRSCWPIQDVLIEYVVQMQEAGQPMKPRELIALANSLIQTFDKFRIENKEQTRKCELLFTIKFLDECYPRACC